MGKWQNAGLSGYQLAESGKARGGRLSWVAHRAIVVAYVTEVTGNGCGHPQVVAVQCRLTPVRRTSQRAGFPTAIHSASATIKDKYNSCICFACADALVILKVEEIVHFIGSMPNRYIFCFYNGLTLWGRRKWTSNRLVVCLFTERRQFHRMNTINYSTNIQFYNIYKLIEKINTYHTATKNGNLN